MKVKQTAQLATVVGLMIVVAACSSAVPTETAGVERLGKFILRERATSADVVLGYKFAANSLGNEWMILEVAMSSPQGQTAKFKREDMFVRTPDGVQIPAASQRAFNEAYAELRPVISQANVMRDPMDYFPPNRQLESLQFFVAPGEGVAFDEVSTNERRAIQGKLFFYIPGGIQPGRYVLGMDFEEDEVRIPFVLEAPE
jgi:hypothetical protein